MTVIILASSFNSSKKDENGVKYPVAIPDTNSFVTNIKKFTPKYDHLVIVANNQYDYEVNDAWERIMSSSFAMTGMNFDKTTVLDSRNKVDAKSIIESADLLLLAGGQLRCQLEFFAEIGLKELIKNHKGLVLGGSAGAMNLCDTVFDFPEYLQDVNPNRKESEYFLNGLGFHNEIIIPHTDDKSNRYVTDEFDPIKDYVIPFSKSREFIMFNDDSYILINGEKVDYFGEFYKAKNGEIILIS